MLEALVTTAAGALSATVGVLVGGIVARRAQDNQWLRDQQLGAYQDLFSHYAKFTMELRQAHGAQRGWDYDWGEWNAALMRAGLVAPGDVAAEIDGFGRAINSFLDQVARSRDPRLDPLSPEAFEQARQAPAQAQVKLVNAIRRSLSRDAEGLPFGIGG
ncbi:hypothetical protein L1785_11370 [Antribacter sp. KLBMP9083]|uniref:Uncharacterized protein n=1 Tax=Antribacter soli TaxID=2910976 RepID=A0AA41QEB8_9MICO|nr:hypothetical protein [Antribacter soli]MCF4121582.1 hypothetical protein [Antribacter soli]